MFQPESRDVAVATDSSLADQRPTRDTGQSSLSCSSQIFSAINFSCFFCNIIQAKLHNYQRDNISCLHNI